MIQDAAVDGRIPNLDAVLQVRESTVASGPAESTRAIDLKPFKGIGIRILPDRGFDIGPAWFGDVPLAWVSSAGETAPLKDPRDMDWNDAFGGGLMTTCGLRNVGMPSEGHGLHGTYSLLPAANVTVERIVDGGPRILASAVIDDMTRDHYFRLERTIVDHAGRGLVEVTDVTENLGRAPEPAPILYHVNLGYPLWSTGAELKLPQRSTTPRDAASEAGLGSWHHPPAVEHVPEQVLEHEIDPGPDGWGWASVKSPIVGVLVTVRWRVAELPRFHQWINPSPGMYVLGIEPANASTGGRGHDRLEDRLPLLEPGERRETRISFEAETV